MPPSNCPSLPLTDSAGLRAGASAPATRRAIYFGAIACATLLMGCEKSEQISTYTVASHESIQTPEFKAETARRRAKPARMLAAIVPQESVHWFFKLQGPPDAVAARETEFREFLKSVRFPTPQKVDWTLPATWAEKRDAGNELRYATLTLAGATPLEVSVTMLPAGDDLTAALLSNINRWRNQLDLPFIAAEDLPTRTETIVSGDLKITLINIVGKAKPGAAMPGGAMPGMSPHLDRPTNQERPSREVAQGEPAESGIKYEKPAEWMQVRPKQFTLAAFEVIDGKKQVSISLSRAGGTKSMNVNRWRGQLGLGPLEEEELAKTLQKFPVGTRKGSLVELKSDTQTLVGVMIEDGDMMVFVKMMGDPKLAAQERERFEAFAKGLKF